jgi:hypothetical protein
MFCRQSHSAASPNDALGAPNTASGHSKFSFKAGLTSFRFWTIFLTVLSMRGASRGVLEVGQSSGAERSAPMLAATGCFRQVDAASRASWLATTAPGGLRSLSGSTTRARHWLADAAQVKGSVSLARAYARKHGPEAQNRRAVADGLETVCGARRKATRSAAKPVASSTPCALPARPRPSCVLGRKTSQSSGSRSRENAKACTEPIADSSWLFDIQIRTLPCPGQGAARSAKPQIRDPGSCACKSKPGPRLCSASRRKSGALRFVRGTQNRREKAATHSASS